MPVIEPQKQAPEVMAMQGPLPDDDLGRDYLAHRQNSELRNAERDLDGLIDPQPEQPSDVAKIESTAPPKPKDDSISAWDSIKEAGGQAAEGAGKAIRGIIESPSQIVGGAIDATNETVEAFFELGNWLREKVPALAVADTDKAPELYREPPGLNISTVAKALESLKSAVPEEGGVLPTTDPAETAVGGAVRKISQFLMGFLPANRAMKAIKLGSMASRAGVVAKTMAAGAIADFSVFDGQEGRLSDLIQQVPALQNPVNEYLASDPNDSQVEGRFKNALEGLGLGAFAEGMGLGLRTLRASRIARQAAQADPTLKAASEAIEDKAAVSLEARIEQLLGNPEGPIFTKREAWGKGSRYFSSEWEDLGSRSGAKVGKDLPERAININFARIDSPDEIKRAISTVADLNAEYIQEARRGTISHEQTIKLADDLGMTVDDLLSRRQGQAFNAEEALAARQLMVSSAEKLHDLAMEVTTSSSIESRFAFQRQFMLHSAIQSQVSGMTAEAGRALNAFKISAQGTKANRRMIEEMLGQLERGASTEDLAGMMLAFDNVGQVSKFAAGANRAKTSDVLLEVWINSLLSGPQTHAVNTLSNTLTAAWMVPERYLAAKIGRARAYFGGEQYIQEGEATAQLFGLVQGTKDGLSLARKAWKTGEPSDLVTKIEVRNYNSLSAESLDLSGNVGRAVDFVGSTVRMPTRALQAEDEFFKAVGYRMELNARAYRQGVQEGLDGEVLAKRMQELIANPPDDLHMAAIDAARYQTFTDPLTGPISRAISKSTNPALRVLFPFVRTPVNLLKFGMERTPLAPFVGRWRADVAAGGARKDLALSKMTLGSMLGAVTADLTMSGKITGGGPSNPEMRQIWLMDHQPYSIKIGNDWYSYARIEPLGMVMGMAADAATIMKDVNQADLGTISSAISIAFAKNVSSKTWLRSVSEFIHAVEDLDNKAMRWIQNMASTSVPNIVAQANRTMVDPVLRDARGIIDGIMARVPGYSKDLPPRRNLWGEPIVLGGGLGPDIVSPIYTKKATKDPVNDEILRNQIEINMPTKSIDGVELTPHEYSRYVELAGNAAKNAAGLGLKDSLDELVKEPRFKEATDGPEGGKALLIKKHIQAFRALARMRLREEYPDLAEKLDDAKRQRAQALRRQ